MLENIGDMKHRKLLKNIGHRTKEETVEIIEQIDMKQEEMIAITVSLKKWTQKGN